MWDTAGAERYRALTAAYYRRAVGALVVYDVTNKLTFESVETWVSEVRLHAEKDVVIVLAGNKIDVDASERQVSTQEGVTLASKLGIPFLETSALDATNVEQAFHALMLEVHRGAKRKDVTPREEDTTTVHPLGDDVYYEVDSTTGKEKKCC